MNFFARIVKCRTLIVGSKYLYCFSSGNTYLKTSCYTMSSQKTLLSFFSKSAGQANGRDAKSSKVAVEDSPVKSKNKKRKVCIESDEESSPLPNKKLNGECSKSLECSSDKERKSLDKGSKKEKEQNEKNSDVSPWKQNEMNEMETDSSAEDNSESKNGSDKNENPDSSVDTTEKQSTSDENENAPKKIHKVKIISPVATAKKTFKVRKFEENENVECETESKDDTISKKVGTTKKGRKSNELKKPENKHKANATKKPKDSLLKNTAKKESIHSFFAPAKSSKNGKDNEEANTKSVPVENNDSPAEETKKESNLDEQSENKDNLVKEMQNVRNQSLGSEEVSPLKKLSKKKIQSIKSEEEESPLKKVPKKKTQSLESDEEGSPVKTTQKKKSQFLESDEEGSPMKKAQKNKSQSLESDEESSPLVNVQKKKSQLFESDEEGSPVKKEQKKKSQSLESDEEGSPVKKGQKKKSQSLESDEEGSPEKKAQKKKCQSFDSDEESSPVKKKVKQVQVEVVSAKKTKRQVKGKETPPKKTKKQLRSSVEKGQKKKSQCLESEDENDEFTSPKSSIKEEIDDAKTCVSETAEKKENSSEQKQKSSNDKEDSAEKEQKTSNDSDSKAKTSSSATLTDSDSKTKKEMFGVKSTSAVETVYNPAKNNYHPIDDAFWKYKEKVPYLALAKTMELIDNTSGRLKTIEILANFFRSVIVLSADDFLYCVYLCLNRVAPEYEGIEMGIGETLLMKAVAQATGRTVDQIKAEVAEKGDLGLVAESSRGKQRVMFAPPKLTVPAVFNKFLEIAKMSGNAAMSKKIDKIKGLFVACRDCEAKYIIRSLQGKLRIGLAEQSILSAIAQAAALTPPNQTYPPEKINASHGMPPKKFKEFLDSQTLILKTAYCECPNYDLVIPVLLKDGISALPERCQLSPGVPLKPMLAHPTAGVDIVLARFGKCPFTCEFKYDGERAQIHMNDKGDIKIFSRNQEDNTSKYPDIISLLPNVIKESTKSFILDSEAVAYDREKNQILPFQVLSTRKRKDAKESEITVQVCVMAFDLLYLNGESLVKKPLEERRSLLHSSFSELEAKFLFAQYRDGDNAETMQEFLDESVKGNCEGLMVKALKGDDALYEIAKRSHNWLKLKKDYLQGVGDTMDLVVIGGYYGKGKRTGNYGGFLLACYDSENEEFQSICKLGTGFKDDILEEHTKFLKQHVIKEPKKYYSYDSSLEPDEWFEPVQVWEIKCADLSVSPVHRAAIGIVDPAKGISLRFPRFIRIRDDKSIEDATSSSQIADMYRNQQQIQNTSSSNQNNEEDFY